MYMTECWQSTAAPAAQAEQQEAADYVELD